MPAATEHELTEPPPQRLYLDTDFTLAALVETEPHHQRCKAFLQRVAELKLTRLYVSSLWWLECADVVLRQAWRDRLPAAIQAQFMFDRWGESLVRQTYLQQMVNRLELLLRSFEWAEIRAPNSIGPEVAAPWAGRNRW